MKKRILYIFAFLLISFVYTQAKDTSYSLKDLFITQIIATTNMVIDSVGFSTFILKQHFPNILKVEESKKLSVSFDPSFSFRFKPALIFEIKGESDLAFDWKGLGRSQNSTPKIELVDAGVFLALNF